MFDDDRLEAMRQQMGLLMQMHLDNEKRMAQMMDAITRLANVVISHDQRLDDIDGR
jgi:hypothetical protein